jgi:quinolinate synthase
MLNLAEIQPRGAMPKEKFQPLAQEIFTLKKQLNAVILAHNYQKRVSPTYCHIFG